MLKQGEYDVWAYGIEAHVMSVDPECWQIIQGGDKKLVIIVDDKEEAKPLSTYTEADFKRAEKNLKSMKLITSGLSSSDKRKFLSSKISQAKWVALEKIYQYLRR